MRDSKTKVRIARSRHARSARGRRLAAALSWPRHRLDATLDQLRAHPDPGGVLALRHHAPREAYTATPRLDVLDLYQVDALTG
ncbi:hypothetical protein ACFYYM_31825 [Streptomyces erythrochromogenes]|uniref:hypothetical protein n=1 Tax=Streptomyces erythrochromogenes TaxID=285574 RepID=UPI0036B45271